MNVYSFAQRDRWKRGLCIYYMCDKNNEMLFNRKQIATVLIYDFFAFCILIAQFIPNKLGRRKYYYFFF